MSIVKISNLRTVGFPV